MAVTWCSEDSAALWRDATAVGFSLTEHQLAALGGIAQAVLDARSNVSGLSTPVEIRVKHLIDSLTCVAPAALQEGERVLDLGTGAGFPGLVLAVMCPWAQVTLLDAERKKTEFVGETAARLAIRVEVVQGRAEELGRDRWWRGSFDCVVCRAVARLPVVLELALPFCRVGGRVVVMKGPRADAELNESRHALDVLGGEVWGNHEVELPCSGGSRRILVIRAAKEAPREYPRRNAMIQRKPL